MDNPFAIALGRSGILFAEALLLSHAAVISGGLLIATLALLLLAGRNLALDALRRGRAPSEDSSA